MEAGDDSGSDAEVETGCPHAASALPGSTWTYGGPDDHTIHPVSMAVDGVEPLMPLGYVLYEEASVGSDTTVWKPAVAHNGDPFAVVQEDSGTGKKRKTTIMTRAFNERPPAIVPGFQVTPFLESETRTTIYHAYSSDGRARKHERVDHISKNSRTIPVGLRGEFKDAKTLREEKAAAAATCRMTLGGHSSTPGHVWTACVCITDSGVITSNTNHLPPTLARHPSLQDGRRLRGA